MYKRQIPVSGNSINSEESSSDSCSSMGVSGKICRICHVVEKAHKPKPRLSLRTAPPAGIRDKTGPANNFFKQLLISTFLSAPEFDEEELIAPCECRGTMRHVHRGCLNQWRTASPRSDSFTRCEQCFSAYTFKHTWVTAVLSHPATIYSVCAVLFVAWVAASTFVSTGAMNSSTFEADSPLLNLLPTFEFEFEIGAESFINYWKISSLLIPYNMFLCSINRLFYGLIFVALTEFIFFTPSFILSFNTLFCIWRIQKYEIFFDKWLLVAFAGFGLWRAGKSLHGMIEAATSRTVKLKLLEVLDRGDGRASQ